MITEWGGTARCMTSDGRNVNMAEELNRLDNEMKKIYDEVEIDQKFELEKLEIPKMPESIKKWADDFLEANGIDPKTILTDLKSLSL